MRNRPRRFKSAFIVFMLMWFWLLSQTVVSCGSWMWDEATGDHDSTLIFRQPQNDSDER